MGQLVKDVSVFSGVLTTAYTGAVGTVFSSDDGDELWVGMVTTGTITTSTDIMVEWGIGTTYYVVSKIDSVTAGIENVNSLSVEHAGGAANGSYSYGPLTIPPGSNIRICAKRTGGDATSAVALTAHVVRR